MDKRATKELWHPTVVGSALGSVTQMTCAGALVASYGMASAADLVTIAAAKYGDNISILDPRLPVPFLYSETLAPHMIALRDSMHVVLYMGLLTLVLLLAAIAVSGGLSPSKMSVRYSGALLYMSVPVPLVAAYAHRSLPTVALVLYAPTMVLSMLSCVGLLCPPSSVARRALSYIYVRVFAAKSTPAP